MSVQEQSPRTPQVVAGSVNGHPRAERFSDRASLSAYRLEMAAERGRRQRSATAWLAGMSLMTGVVMALTVASIFPVMLTAAGILDAVSMVSAAAGTLGILLLVVLASRIPALDRAFGHDGLIAWHKLLGPWSLGLIAVHIVASVSAVAFAAADNAVGAAVSFVVSDGDLILALLGALVFALGGVTSWSKVRGRLPRTLWWSIHLSLYAGIILAFFHQITAGGPFISGFGKAMWIGLYAVVASLVVIYRCARPLMVTTRHGLTVETVVEESPGVVSVWLRGRDLDSLGLEPGQFMTFRFLSPGLMWHAHPFSVSSPPHGNLMRITVAAAGVATSRMRFLRPGIRVAVEGPHGVLTPVQFGADRAVLVGGGVGIAPLVPLAKEFAARGVATDVVYRVPSEERAPLLGELTELHRAGRIKLHLLVGPRAYQPLHAARLRSLLGDISQAEIYLCGPVGLTTEVRVAARALGTAPNRIHTELFEM